MCLLYFFWSTTGTGTRWSNNLTKYRPTTIKNENKVCCWSAVRDPRSTLFLWVFTYILLINRLGCTWCFFFRFFLQFLTQQLTYGVRPLYSEYKGKYKRKEIWGFWASSSVYKDESNHLFGTHELRTASNKLTCTLQTSSNRLPRINLGAAGIPLRLLRNALRYTQVKSWGDWSYQHSFVIVILRL
jgi:hypothetical protein